MSIFSFFVVSACSILIPILIFLLRWNRLKSNYIPFILMLITGCLNEGISYIRIYARKQNTLNANIYVLIEILLIICFFAKLKGTYSNKILKKMIILGISVWILDNFVINSIYSNNSIFRMVASLFVVILSIDKINQLLFGQSTVKLNNTDLLISFAFLINFSYKTFVEAFNIFPMPIVRKFFYPDLWIILGAINIITNILFAVAILCKPKKQEFTLHLSQV